MKAIMIIATLLIPLMFGFVLFGSGSSGSGFSGNFVSSNKVFAPAMVDFGATTFLSFRSFQTFRPSFEPVHLNAAAAFRWNFFDP
jgi:hypothetical protein